MKRRKGAVGIISDRGWLRLRWRHQGRQYTLSLGLADNDVNRTVAQRKASEIEADIHADQISPGAGRFDRTLEKYRSGPGIAHALSVVSLFERYAEWKRKTLEPESLQKYRGLLGYLGQFFRARLAADVSESQAFEFRDWLLQRIEPITTRERIGMLRSCWQWAIKRKLVAENPWSDVRVKVPPRPKPRPFTKEEIGQILQHAKSTPKYQCYADLIEFCLSVGCRPGEAAGLKWSALTDDCSGIWIGESWGRGRQKSTKTNEARSFELTEELQAMLQARKPDKCSGADYVFQAPKGGPIDDHNFRRRCWRPLLEELGIPYRMPRRTRATFISHAIDQGWSVPEVAAITGNSEETILRNYVGNPRGRTKLRRVF
ncbi:MAG TPA: tyrosine-type recombinase/integrase [Trichocoleus sp.]